MVRGNRNLVLFPDLNSCCWNKITNFFFKTKKDYGCKLESWNSANYSELSYSAQRSSIKRRKGSKIFKPRKNTNRCPAHNFLILIVQIRLFSFGLLKNVILHPKTRLIIIGSRCQYCNESTYNYVVSLFDRKHIFLIDHFSEPRVWYSLNLRRKKSS